MPESLDKLMERRVKFLTAYQDANYAQRYHAFVEKVRAAETKLGHGDALAKAVARYLFKLMAYKDEYEVARLYADAEFEKRLKDTFEGDFKIKYNLAPPLLAKRDAQGHLLKAQYGSWIRPAFALLSRLKFLRGGAFDVFGYSEERRMERRLIDDYRASIESALVRLNDNNLALAVELASLPEQIRGFGHVKQAHVGKVKERWRALEAQLEDCIQTARRAA